MDGTLAAIFLLTGLTDTALNHCMSGCLAESKTQSRLSFQVAAVEFQNDLIGEEIYIGYDYGRTIGAFQPTLGVSATDAGALWTGFGAKWTSQDIYPGPIFVETSLMPGLYLRGDGPDIGGALQFRSALGVGYAFDNGATLTVSYDHRSNADTQSLNPGLETISIRYAFALR